MIPITELMKAPKDINTMLTRKSNNFDYKISGVAINKKSGQAYNITILMDTKEMSVKSKLKVKCSCSDFKFRWAYVLSTKDALLSPGEFQLTPPVKTNPDNVMNACKHIHAFIKNEMDDKLKTFSKRKGSL